MYYSLKPRNKKELFLIKPIRRSNYLKNLEKQTFAGLECIEEEKANILIDKILGKGTIFRDYSVFSNHLNDSKRYIKNINSINKDNYITNYKSCKLRNKLHKKKNINNSKDFHKIKKMLNKMSKETFIKRNLERENFLSIIGKDIINSNY